MAKAERLGEGGHSNLKSMPVMTEIDILTDMLITGAARPANKQLLVKVLVGVTTKTRRSGKKNIFY
jgi:hypothetical protein